MRKESIEISSQINYNASDAFPKVAPKFWATDIWRNASLSIPDKVQKTAPCGAKSCMAQGVPWPFWDAS